MHTREEKIEAFGRLLDIMDALRQRCPWNAEQTMETLRPMTEEEVYELSDEVLGARSEGVCKEIGDLMYHLVFYARIGEELGQFDIADSIERICAKMVFRHPHVFRQDGSLVPEGEAPSAKEIADTWELIKAREKDGNKTVLGGIPDSMPAMLKALSMQEKARGCGFDWKQPSDVWTKVREEMSEVEEAVSEGDTSHIGEELGDLLFSVINASRLYGIDPEAALSRTCSKFRKRFTYIEKETIRKGRSLSEISLEQMDALWNEAKKL